MSLVDPDAMTAGPRRTVLIGALPPPTTGQAVAFRVLVAEFAARQLPHAVVDISERGQTRPDGRFAWGRAWSMLRSVARAVRLCWLRRRSNVYLIVAQSWTGCLRDLAFVTVARLGRHRVVLHVHGGGYGEFHAAQSRFRKRLIRWMCGRAERIVVLGSGLVAMFDFLPERDGRVVVVENGLALNEAELPDQPKRLPSRGQVIQLLFLSNLIESKGYLDVLAAARSLHEQGVAVRVEFCGAFLVGSDAEVYSSVAQARAGFEQFVDEHQLGDVVSYRGVIEGEELASALAASEFLVLPTRYNNEGQPLCIIEALAYGCVVLSTRHRAIPDLLDGGRAGEFVVARRPESIVRAVVGFRDDPERFEAVSRRAIEHRRERYRLERHLDELVSVITRP